MSTEATNPTGSSFENHIDLEKLHLNSKWSDVKFLFDSGDGTASESISANKAVLAAQSDVFDAMFYGELKEKGDIMVTDASIGAFKEFLQFFHLNRVKLTVENVADVMDLGHKYNVIKCVDTCAEFLKGAISVDVVCVALSLAKLYEHQNLLEFCEKYIANHAEAVLKSKSFLECDKPVLAHLLKMDSLTCSETIVFEACMAWIEAKSQQNEVTKQLIQEHLGELFYKITFTSMTFNEFDDLSIAHECVFSFAEYKDIMRTFASPMETSKLFNKHARQRLWLWDEGSIITCNRNTDPTSNGFFFEYNKPTQFESNQPMLLGTLLFAPIYVIRDSNLEDLESGFPIDVTIIEISNQSKSANESTRAISNFKISLPSRKETSIKLPDPVRVQPGFNYEIRLNPLKFIDNLQYDCGNLIDEVQIKNDVVINFHGDREFTRNHIVNLITGLGFNQIQVAESKPK